MADNVNTDLILEHLKAIQTRLSQISDDITEIKEENRAHRSLTSALVQGDELRGTQVANIQVRLERIERRLDLREEV